MRILTLTSLIILLTSCDRETAKLKAENDQLKLQNDSLTNWISELDHVPWLSNLNFETAVNDTFYTDVLLIQEKGILVDSVKIKGLSKSKSENMTTILENGHVTTLKFVSDSIGTFELKAYSRVPSWDNKVVPLMFPVKVKKP